MFETLFGSELPLPVRFFLAFLIVLGLIGATAWAVRRFGSRPARRRQRARPSAAAWRHRLRQRRRAPPSDPGAPRQCRASSHDRRTDRRGRRSQYRARGRGRRATSPLARPPAVEPLPRAIPLPENGNGSWPLQPEPARRRPPRATPKFEPPARRAGRLAAAAGRRHAGKPQRDTLAALADELSARPTPPPRNRSPLPRERRSGRTAPPSRVPNRALPAPQPAPAPVSAETAAADQSLAEMAHRLEAALRKPNAPAERARTVTPRRRAGATRAGRSARSRCRTAGAATARRAPDRTETRRAREAKPNQSRPRSTTTSNRRWQVCWAARQTRTE